jgi:preprotein translocase subunit SecF
MKKLNLHVAERSKIWFAFSTVLLLISIVSIFIFGFNLGIDFQGGTIITIELNTQFETDDIREFTDVYDPDADITYAGDDETQVIISTKEDLSSEDRVALFDSIQEAYDLDDTDLLSIDDISAAIGSELLFSSFLACVVAVLCMLIYITIRFEFTFGIAAIIALAHDLIIVLGVYAIFQIPINTPFIAAMLTILGYSINDTIVVFDRIRENRSRYGRNNFTELVNESISQVMSRSINTSLTTVMALLALYIIGVDSLKDFALPMIVGFISGTYSSIFVASAIWYNVKQKFGDKKRTRSA